MGLSFQHPHFYSEGVQKEDFDNLGDSIVADIRTVIELIEKGQETLLNGDNKEEAQSPTV